MSENKIDVLAAHEKIMHAAALLSQKGEPRASNALIETADAVAALVERGRALQRKAGSYEWKMFAEALARVQGGAA